jgi:hypothetical protein
MWIIDFFLCAFEDRFMFTLLEMLLLKIARVKIDAIFLCVLYLLIWGS